MLNASNAFGVIQFKGWANDNISAFIKAFNMSLGSTVNHFYINIDDEILPETYHVHGEGNFSIESFLSDIDLHEFLPTKNKQFVSLCMLDEESVNEQLTTLKGEFIIENGRLTFNFHKIYHYPYTRTMLRYFDLYDEFEVDEDEYLSLMHVVYPKLTTKKFNTIDHLVDTHPHASLEQLMKLTKDLFKTDKRETEGTSL